jgi:TRAP-type C4-dicarboxylate transport system permease small subunit
LTIKLKYAIIVVLSKITPVALATRKCTLKRRERKMKELISTAVLVIFGLVLGNFGYQLMTGGTPQWGVAAERSLFQALAVALVVFFGLMATKTRR